MAAKSFPTKNSRPRPLLQILLLCLSLFLLWTAFPRLQASLLYLPVDTAINRYYDQGAIDTAQLPGLQQRARDAIAAHPHHRYWDGLSLLHFLQAADTGRRLNERRQSFEAVIDTAEQSLAMAPAQPRTWLRVAQARSWLRYPPDEVIDALKMAIYTGRVEPSMFLTRLVLGLAYLPRMDGEGQSMMRDQLLLSWQMQRGTVASALRQGELRLSAIEPLLEGGHGAVLEEMREVAGGAAR